MTLITSNVLSFEPEPASLSETRPGSDSPDCVIFLHGLARTKRSMQPVVSAFAKNGYRTVNAGYPSRERAIEALAQPTIDSALVECAKQGYGKVHFVTHSMGGILLREYLSRQSIDRLGRVVMLGPPNQGSEIVDRLGNVPGFAAINGPAGLQLGTDIQSKPRSLGPVDFELGVIAGTRSINPILSSLMPKPNDGKVSVASAHVEGMRELIALPVTHSFMMMHKSVIEQSLHFITHGHFAPLASSAHVVQA